MLDASFLIVKPELISTRGSITAKIDGPVAKSLTRRGFTPCFNAERSNWQEFTMEIYKNVLNPEQLNAYLEGYAINCWGSEYSFFIIEHPEGQTMKRLKDEQGSFKGYQEKIETTLRAEFGLPKEFNRSCGEMTLVYSGVHCPGNDSELLNHIKFLNLEKIFSI